MTDPPFTGWLHKLSKPQIAALFEYRRTARAAYPDAPNAMDAAWDDAPHDVQKMPRAFVVSLDRGL